MAADEWPSADITRLLNEKYGKRLEIDVCELPARLDSCERLSIGGCVTQSCVHSSKLTQRTRRLTRNKCKCLVRLSTLAKRYRS
jgi:hypothetical protein